MIDWTISVGNVVAAVGFVAGASGIVWALRADVKVMSSRLDSIENQVLKIVDVLVHIGRQDEQIKSVTHRVDKLEDKVDG
jgi:tetrahydromethanopterin S-methyltransferase subunit G